MSLNTNFSINVVFDEATVSESGLTEQQIIDSVIENIKYQIGNGMLTAGHDELIIDEYKITGQINS